MKCYFTLSMQVVRWRLTRDLHFNIEVITCRFFVSYVFCRLTIYFMKTHDGVLKLLFQGNICSSCCHCKSPKRIFLSPVKMSDFFFRLALIFMKQSKLYWKCGDIFSSGSHYVTGNLQKVNRGLAVRNNDFSIMDGRESFKWLIGNKLV